MNPITQTVLITIGTITALVASGCATCCPADRTSPPQEPSSMQLGAFSVSLTVKDLEASRAFYEKLGFKATGGDASQNWLVLRNGTTTIGLFQGMFDKNILTFNPGWNHNAEPLDSFTDVRELERVLRERGIEPVQSAAPGNGPAHVVLEDPDGNPILIDQHVNKPE